MIIAMSKCAFVLFSNISLRNEYYEKSPYIDIIVNSVLLL